jgi:hypothetical protein
MRYAKRANRPTQSVADSVLAASRETELTRPASLPSPAIAWRCTNSVLTRWVQLVSTPLERYVRMDDYRFGRHPLGHCRADALPTRARGANLRP